MQIRHLLPVLLIPFALAVGATALLGASPSADANGEMDDEAAAQGTARPAVLVTGATSGIGLRTTEVLSANGYFVYAGARKDADMERLDAMDNVQAVRLDVTDPEQIAAAVATVTEGGRGLHGLINNAGVAVVAPLIEVTDEDLAFQFDVNVMGPVRVTRAFADLLIESGGRVATTGSISGFVTWPFGGPYTMSKHAVEAYTDTLAAELAPFGVSVSIVDPGNYRSSIMASMHERMVERGYTTEGSRYAESMDRFLEGPSDRRQYDEPDAVADAFLELLRADEPARRVMVVPSRSEAELTLYAALERAVELADNPEHPFTDDEVLGMLKVALDRAR